MKGIQHHNKKDVFADWVNQWLIPDNKQVYWPQITYEWNSCEPMHIVFEKNHHSFVWPWDVPIYLKWPVTNIDFTDPPPKLPDGSDWDFWNWHQSALNCGVQNQVREVPQSFWNWRFQTKPQGNATCDLDVLYQRGDTWVGVEATEIWYVDENEQCHNRDCYHHISNLIRKRKAFNFNALLAQAIFMQSMGGEHYFLLHQINKAGMLVDARVIIIPLNSTTINILQEHCNTREGVKQYLGPHIRFMSMIEFFFPSE